MNPGTSPASPSIKTSEGYVITIGSTVFFSIARQHWPYDVVMKSHHVYETQSVILRGEVLAIENDKLTIRLFDNNGFEKDGESCTLHKDNLLCNQDFTDTERLGIWKDDPLTNRELAEALQKKQQK